MNFVPLFLLVPVLIFSSFSCKAASPGNDSRGTGVLVFSDCFTGELDSSKWVVEMAPVPYSSVRAEAGHLVLDTRGGVTVWLNKKLSGNYIIEFMRTVMVEGQPNDRLSDLNQFWMATDPDKGNLFTRSGVFEEYHDLLTYYVGFGGNHNTTNRFRRYDGEGQRPLIEEKNYYPYLLEPNKPYLITIKVYDGLVSFTVNGQQFFEFQDPEPLTSGYFGFRSTWSRQHIDFINIYKLE